MTKPITHLRQGETLVIAARDGTQYRHPLTKTEQDGALTRITVPPTTRQGHDGKPLQAEPSGVYVLDSRENVQYEARS